MSDSGVDAGDDSDSLGQMSVGSSAGSEDGDEQQEPEAVDADPPLAAQAAGHLIADIQDERRGQDGVAAGHGVSGDNAAIAVSGPSEPVAGGSGFFALTFNSPDIGDLCLSSPSFLQYQQWKHPLQAHDLCSKIRVNRKTGTKLSSILDNDIIIQKKLQLAANSGDTELIGRLLDDGADPCACDHRNRTPLHFAACKGEVSVARLLLERGADPNLQDVVGNTPLHLAACTNHTEMVTLLLKYGTDVTSLDKSGRSPIQLAQSKLKILQQASEGKEVSCLKTQVLQVIEMMHVYLQRSGKQAAIDLLTTFTSRLHLHQTKEEVDCDVQDLLSNLSHMSIRHN